MQSRNSRTQGKLKCFLVKNCAQATLSFSGTAELDFAELDSAELDFTEAVK